MISRRGLLGLGALLLGSRLGRVRALQERSRFGAGSVRSGKRVHTGLVELGPKEIVVGDGSSEKELKIGRVDAIVLPRRGASDGPAEGLAGLDEQLAGLARRLLADPTATSDLEEWIELLQRGFLPLFSIGPPVAGAFWIVPDESRHHALHAASACALDVAPVDAKGRVHTGKGKANEDWLSWERELLAVADGRVLRARDDLPDDEAWKGVADPARANDLVLALEGGLAFYQHLRQGSLEVEPGADVERGDVLARIGNSGNSTWPHLHFAVYERFEGEGRAGTLSVPAALDACRVTGLRKRPDGRAEALDVRCENVAPQEGWVVEPAGW